MKIPDELNYRIEYLINGVEIKELKLAAQKLSSRYMNEERMGQSLLSKDIEALAYSIMRMPATFGAVYTSLKNTLNLLDNLNVSTVLDIGAGTGAAEWAINSLMNISEFLCLEREESMRKIGKSLMENNSEFEKVKWIDEDIKNIEEIPDADLIILSYMINELKKEERIKIIDKLFNAKFKILLIIEPGTPEGFNNIKEIQKLAINNKLYIVAPCTSQNECKLPEEDWCHTTVRVERTKIHKILKNADVPYEDEKFSYIVISKENLGTEKSRILRHPKIEAGKITLKLCTNGEIEEKVITKKDKEKFKIAKKKNCGDAI